MPDEVLTLAEHMHGAGYQTTELTSNPNAGRISNLTSGNDAFRDAGLGAGHSISSVALHENFWRWRAAYPGEPYLVHFQTTDVHGPHTPVAPFAGLFIGPSAAGSPGNGTNALPHGRVIGGRRSSTRM